MINKDDSIHTGIEKLAASKAQRKLWTSAVDLVSKKEARNPVGRFIGDAAEYFAGPVGSPIKKVMGSPTTKDYTAKNLAQSKLQRHKMGRGAAALIAASRKQGGLSGKILNHEAQGLIRSGRKMKQLQTQGKAPTYIGGTILSR